MTSDQQVVLEALYRLEGERLKRNEFNQWTSPEDVSAALPSDHARRGDAGWVRNRLQELWIARAVLQVPTAAGSYDLTDVILNDGESFGGSNCRLPLEADDCRGPEQASYAQVAIFGTDARVVYRSRVAEITRLLGLNFQRFQMLPATGLLRYERRPQRRPLYDRPIAAVSQDLQNAIARGELPEAGESARLSSGVDRARLSQAVSAVLSGLEAQFLGRGLGASVAAFQVESISATLRGLYSADSRQRTAAHVVTAGVGSGKSFAFQIGALIHVAYQALLGNRGIQVLLLYPRVVLAANQFQELDQLIDRVNANLGIAVEKPILDAGGKLAAATGGGEPVRGALYEAIRSAYQGQAQILISNLDTLANRLVHPEASRGLTRRLDLVVFDEVHLLSGLYGAHARMLLKRLANLRAVWQVREARPSWSFAKVLEAASRIEPAYLIAASATIAEPRRHVARVTGVPPDRCRHIEVTDPRETGSVHHVFLRQRPEVSSMTAAVNAVSCLIHNRRNGLNHEYYAKPDDNSPLALDALPNPVQPSPLVTRRSTREIHKTIAFSDSLDGVNRWADLISDNERTKSASMNSSPNPAVGGVPYFVRFQEPLWRVVHHITFGDSPTQWQSRLWRHYGALCRDCKKGIKSSVSRVPDGLTNVQRQAVDRLWGASPGNDECYLARLGVDKDHFGAVTFRPLQQAASSDHLHNLDGCAFFATGLCWWWSMDHLGSNHPAPVGGASPLNGYKKLTTNAQQKYAPVNAVRVRSFTSKSTFDVDDSINDLYSADAASVFRDSDFAANVAANCSLLIGSPRIEVGVDLARVTDGVTFRAMRDPSSLQQKVGRVGREPGTDALLVHVVTESARDHFYLRNPRVALDPEYLQPIPLHEQNQLVARNHYFMAIFDFLVTQGSNPPQEKISADGDRIALVNDALYARPLMNWDRKVAAAYEYLFAPNAAANVNLLNLRAYLTRLGATATDIGGAAASTLGPSDAPLAEPAGAIDVFRHDCGPNLLLTRIPFQGRTFSLAEVCSTSYRPPLTDVAGLPRHSEFLRSLPQDNPLQKRSYLFNILKLPLFRRGIPLQGVRGNQPYLWTPNFFDAVGKEYVRVFSEINGQQREVEYETLGIALSLLVPGTVTYRYSVSPRKVPVSRLGGAGVSEEVPRVFGVRLDVSNAEYFEPAGCDDLLADDLPREYPGDGGSVRVYRPRQLAIVPSNSEPLVALNGLIADGDETDPAMGVGTVPTPPRCFPLKWYRVRPSSPALQSPPCRVQQGFAVSGEEPLPRMEWPPISRLFTAVQFDTALDVTEFVWGLDRHFMSRQIDGARLVYRDADGANAGRVALGHRFQTAGLRFVIDLRAESPVGTYISSVLQRLADSPVGQAVLFHTLHEFLAESARDEPTPGAPWWIEASRPSLFTVRNLKTIVTFHLLERWHPASAVGTPATRPPLFSFEEVRGCFDAGHQNYIDAARFRRLCRWIAEVQDPVGTTGRLKTLTACEVNFRSACERLSNFTEGLVRTTCCDLVVDGLAVSIHNAALRQTGAETGDVGYFRKVRPDAEAEVFLFDADEFGNGSCELVSENFFVSPVERVLAAREQALGGAPDPLPSTDFLDCLEEALHECSNSHAAHLAFWRVNAAATAWAADLVSAVVGETAVAESAFALLRSMNISSFDHLLPFQLCPEFLAHVSGYGCYGRQLVPSPEYPTFQALESAMGFCVDGCVACVVAPEHSIHGPLGAKDAVSKLVLDHLYRSVVCEDATNAGELTYPGTGVGRTEMYGDLAAKVAECIGRSLADAVPLRVRLRTSGPPIYATVIRAASSGTWSRVLRPSWDAPSTPTSLVRPRMPF